MVSKNNHWFHKCLHSTEPSGGSLPLELLGIREQAEPLNLPQILLPFPSPSFASAALFILWCSK